MNIHTLIPTVHDDFILRETGENSKVLIFDYSAKNIYVKLVICLVEIKPQTFLEKRTILISISRYQNPLLTLN